MREFINSLFNDPVLFAAFAFLNLQHKPFVPKDIAQIFYDLKDVKFTLKVQHHIAIKDICRLAVEQGLLDYSPGPRGGFGCSVPSTLDSKIVNVEIPHELIRSEQDNSSVAKDTVAFALENPAPSISNMLSLMIMTDDYTRNVFYQEAKFVFSVFEFWLRNCRLSLKQAQQISNIAAKYNHLLIVDNIVGKAPIKWVTDAKPHYDRLVAFSNERFEVERAEKDKEMAELQERYASIRAHNEEIRDQINNNNFDENIKKVTEVMAAVFPDNSCSNSMIKQALIGSGSRALRLAIAYVFFDRPSFEIWVFDSEVVKENEKVAWIDFKAEIDK